MQQASTAPVRVLIIIQSRMGSSRLPGKALLPLPLNGGPSVLAHVVKRAQAARSAQRVVVAVPSLPADDTLAAAAQALGAHVFRGDAQDVLGRFAGALAAHQAEAVVRITGDNPAIDPAFIDAAVEHHFATAADYTLTTGLPLGTNLEVIAAPALRRAHLEATLPEEREHVTPYLRRHPELFRLETLPCSINEAVSCLRLTLDYPSDYALFQLLFTLLPEDFSLTDPTGLPALLRQYPWLASINNQNVQVQA